MKMPCHVVPPQTFRAARFDWRELELPFADSNGCWSRPQLFHCTYRDLQGWMFHVKGACRLLQLRGPPSPELPLNLSLYSRIRITAVCMNPCPLFFIGQGLLDC